MAQPGYGAQPQQQQHQHQQAAMGGGPPAGGPPMGTPPAGGGGVGSAIKSHPALAVALLCFTVAVLFAWILGAFEITDKDVGRFLMATAGAAATSGFGALLAKAFSVVTAKDKQPTFGQSMVCIAILLAIPIMLALGAAGAAGLR